MTSTQRRITVATRALRSMITVTLGFSLLELGIGAVLAADWPQWRGPRRDAISEEDGLLDDWTDTSPKKVWNASGLGEGYASVVVSQGSLFTIGKHGDEVFCFALDVRTGQERWARKFGRTARIPLSTPTVDGDHVYVLDADGDLACLKTATGEIVWQKSFLEDFDGQMMSGRGYGESPLVDGDRLICTPGGAESILVALDKQTGAVDWKSGIPDIGAAGSDGAGFSSIVVTTTGGIRQYVQLVGRGVIGMAASDGRFLWGYNDLTSPTANIPTPIVRDDLVFASNGYGVGSVLLQLMPDGMGGVNVEEVYRLRGNRFQNHHGGIILVGDHVYGGHGSNNGLPTCIELETGRIVWKRRGPGVGSAAVIFADGHLYFRYQNGVMALIEATPNGYHLKGTFQIPAAGGDSWAHPVIAHGQLYLREKDQLWVYDLKTIGDVAVRPQTLSASDAEMTSLRQLGVGVEQLTDLPSLDHLDKQRLDRYLDVRRGEPKTTGRLVVTLTRDHLTPHGMIAPRLLPSLSKMSRPFLLNLAGTTISDSGLKQIGEWEQMAGLNLEFCRNITDQGLAHLRKARVLRVLSLTGTGVTDQGLKQIATISSLRALDLEVCDGVTDAGCESLAGMQQLRALVLKKTGFEVNCITGIGLQHLSGLSRLELLNLYGNRMTDDDLVHLESMKELRELDLSLLAITDDGLSHLSPLQNMERLELLYATGFSGPAVTNAGLESLQTLTKLQSLNLIGSKITDDGVKLLITLEQLGVLKVINTGLTEAGVRRLQAALPGCTIDR